MKLRRTVGLALASIGLTIGFSNPAMAADHTMHTGDVWGSISGYSGEGYNNEYGDVVTICDKDADGYAVIMYVYLGGAYGAPRYNFYVGGEGNCATHRAADGGKYDLPEGENIGFLFCRYKDGYESECKAYSFVNDH
ncbi:hypothetical protein [Streptomyces sp. NPDC001070]